MSTDLFEYCKCNDRNLLSDTKPVVMVADNKVHGVTRLLFVGEWCTASKGVWMIEVNHLGHKGLKKHQRMTHCINV